MDEPKKHAPAHFEGKDPLSHVVEKQLGGVLSQAEMHGMEMPGHIVSGADSLRETSLFLLMVWTTATHFSLKAENPLLFIAILGLGWVVWKTARSGWLGFQRLDRLHRVMEQERWEIEHHRDQEKEELKELYRAKGFEGKLLDDVVEVLMADGDRLLKVMLEEELGFSLEKEEHPMKQALGAFAGSIIALGFFLSAVAFLSPLAAIATAIGLMGVSGIAYAYYEKNPLIPAVVWNMSMGVASFGVVYFLLKAWVEVQ